MLRVMREQSYLAYGIFSLLIVIFAFNFGPGSGGCGGANPSDYAAKVNGDIIRRDEFQRRYAAQLESYRRQFSRGGGELSEDLIERLGLKNQIIDELINERLVAQEAQHWGLAVDDAELLDYLKKTYRVEDVDFADYENWVARNFDMTVTRFERRVREELIGQRLAKLVADNLAVSDAELKTDYLREHDRVMVNFVRFDPEDLGKAPAAPTDVEVAAALSDQKDAVQAYFDKNGLAYHKPEKRRGRQILIKVKGDAPEAEVATARGKLLELKAQIDGGADFAAIAKANSQDEVSRDKGGDMGLIERGEILRPLSDALFGLSMNEVTAEPVKSPLGLHLFQLVEIEPAGRLDFETVKERVAADMLRDKRRDEAAKAAADELIAQLGAGKKLEELTITEEEKREAEEKATDKAAVVSKPVRRDTAWIQRDSQAIPRIGASPEMVADLFSMTAEQPVLKTPHKVGRSYFVVTLKERETPDLAKFDAEKDKLRDEAIWDKRSRVHNEWLKGLRQKATVDLNPAIFPPPAAPEAPEAKG